MGRRGGWQKREGLRMKKLGVKRRMEEKGGFEDEEVGVKRVI